MLRTQTAVMNANCCSHAAGSRTKAAGSLISGALAILLPKCPLCIAGWVAAGTGLAVPTMLAGAVRPALAAVCVLAMFLLIRRRRVI